MAGCAGRLEVTAPVVSSVSVSVVFRAWAAPPMALPSLSARLMVTTDVPLPVAGIISGEALTVVLAASGSPGLTMTVVLAICEALPCTSYATPVSG